LRAESEIERKRDRERELDSERGRTGGPVNQGRPILHGSSTTKPKPRISDDPSNHKPDREDP
jgi:hypothetical protein